MDIGGRKTKNGIIFNMAECGGCRTCEMACSFHHKGNFSPVNSCLKILDRDDKKGFDVLIINKDNNNLVCDGCPELDTPLCVQFCKEKEKLKKMVGIARVIKEKSDK